MVQGPFSPQALSRTQAAIRKYVTVHFPGCNAEKNLHLVMLDQIFILIVCNCTSLWGQPTKSLNNRLSGRQILIFLFPSFHTSLFLSTGAFLFPKWYDQIRRNAPNRIGWTTDTWLTFTDIILITASIPWNYLSGSTYDLYANRLWNPTWPIHEYHVQLLKNKKME